MTCGLHGKLDAAVTAVKTALTTALDADIAEKDLEDILAAYTNLKSVAKRNIHDEPQITFTPDPTLGGAVEFNDNITINTDDLVGAADTVSVNIGGGLPLSPVPPSCPKNIFDAVLRKLKKNPKSLDKSGFQDRWKI